MYPNTCDAVILRKIFGTISEEPVIEIDGYSVTMTTNLRSLRGIFFEDTDKKNRNRDVLKQ